MPLSDEEMSDLTRYMAGVYCPYCVHQLSEDKKRSSLERHRQMQLAQQRGVVHLGLKEEKVVKPKKRERVARGQRRCAGAGACGGQDGGGEWEGEGEGDGDQEHGQGQGGGQDGLRRHGCGAHIQVEECLDLLFGTNSSMED